MSLLSHQTIIHWDVIWRTRQVGQSNLEPPPGHSERPFSTLETRSRISSFQSHALRRDREFLSFSLMFRDEIENFFPSVSCFETRSRISVFILVLRDETEKNVEKKCTFVELSCWEFVEILPDQTLVFRWSCRLHEQLSSNDINFHNFKNIKFGQDCFLKLLLSLLSKCHFLTGHCVRRVKVKVASKGLVKTLIPSSEISCKTI